MTAFRLAEFVEGTTDVDGMLDRMTPEQFQEWCAKDEVEPIGYSSRMLGMIGFMLATYMAGESSDVNANDFMPWEKFAPEAKPQNQQAAAIIRSVIGG